MQRTLAEFGFTVIDIRLPKASLLPAPHHEIPVSLSRSRDADRNLPDSLNRLHRHLPGHKEVPVRSVVYRANRESRPNSLAINDNTSGRSYRPNTVDAAVDLARKLIGRGTLLMQAFFR